jgi:hypothetical protein
MSEQNGMGEVTISLAIKGTNEETLRAWAIKFLEGQGWSVRPPNERWEKVNDYCKRLRIHSQTLSRAAARPERPNAIIIRGGSGRILELLSNPDFDAFVTRHKGRLKQDSRNHAEIMRKRRATKTEPNICGVTAAQ